MEDGKLSSTSTGGFVNVAALIPCRTGSKGIPHKNFKKFCGKPLWQWTHDVAISSGVFDKIFLSSDGGFNGVGDTKLSFFDNHRPAELSDDKANLDDLLKYYSTMNKEYDVWCLLQPTSPLRTPDDIRKAYSIFNEKGSNDDYKYESLVSVCPNPVFAWIKNSVGVPGDDDLPQPLATYHYTNRPNRNDRSDWFLENGAIYFTRMYIIKIFGVRLQGSIVMYEMPKSRSIEIDDPIDWNIAQHLMRRKNGMG
jgi:CMP-N,N'-diacetyllegionaminic acid synthase